MKKNSRFLFLILFFSLICSSIADPALGFEFKKAPSFRKTLPSTPSTTPTKPLPTPTERSPTPTKIPSVLSVPPAKPKVPWRPVNPIRSSWFNNVVGTVFLGAIFQANSCYGVGPNGYAYLEIPRTTIIKKISIVNFHNKLVPHDIDQTYDVETSTKVIEVFSCIWHWTDKYNRNLSTWNGRIENGKFVVSLPIGLNRRGF